VYDNEEEEWMRRDFTVAEASIDAAWVIAASQVQSLHTRNPRKELTVLTSRSSISLSDFEFEFCVVTHDWPRPVLFSTYQIDVFSHSVLFCSVLFCSVLLCCFAGGKCGAEHGILFEHWQFSKPADANAKAKGEERRV
jgi:hypothetical protein